MPAKDKPNHVDITINDETYNVHKGNHPVISLRNKANVPNDHEFNMLVDGEFIQLDNKDKVDIKGGEVFVSHQPSGGAS